MLFKDLSLIEPLLRALETEGYERPTPIQEQAIPPVLQRRDLLGCAQTGTGKTAAFALPILQILHAERAANRSGGGKSSIRALILTPTRELAIQIGDSFTAYGRHTGVRNLVIFGGVGQTPQTDALKRGTDILVATPGRLLDLMNQGFISLRDIGIFVLDEADRMLDMGFIHDVKKVIAKLPTQRQTLFFSATMPPEIAQLAHSILTDPVRVEVTPVSSTAEKVAQKVFFVEKKDKKHLLVHLLKDKNIVSALVFSRTKHGANKIAGDLTKAGVRAEAIHGNKSQNARQAALANFKSGRLRVLVATDIAARGIDIEELSHVINFDLPNIPETYVHRIGRTGRAGASGIAFSFCDTEELPYLKDIQKLTGQLVPVEREHPFAADLEAPALPPSRGVAGVSANNNRKDSNAKKQPAPMVKTPAPQRPGIIPLPDRKPDIRRQEPTNRPVSKNVAGNAPSANGDHNRPVQPQRDAKVADKTKQVSAGNNNGRHDNSTRNEQRPAHSKQSTQQPPRQEYRDRPGDKRRSDESKRRPQQQQPPAKPTATEAAAAMRNRFASILEVATIEKQERPPKPKPHYRDRDDRNSDNRLPFKGDRKKKRW